MRNVWKLVVLLFILNFASQRLFAAAYWLEITGTGKVNKPATLKLFYGSMNEQGMRVPDTGKEYKLAGNYKLSVIDAEGRETRLKLSPANDHWEASFQPERKGVYHIIGVHNTHPVIDRSASGGENILPIDYLCAVYEVGAKETLQTSPLQKLYIMVGTKGKSRLIKVFADDKPSDKGTKLRVFNPENWEKELTLNEKGEATFYPTMKGLYIIRQDRYNNKPGQLDGVNYARIRYRCNYYLLVK